MERRTSVKIRSILKKMLIWCKSHLTEKRQMGILAFITGIGCAIAALLLKTFVSLLHEFVSTQFSNGSLNYLYLFTPIIGISIASAYVKYIVKDDLSHGVTKIMYAIARNRAVIKLHNCWSSVIASSLTIGFGGSVGAEAPIVLTGSAIGSNLGQFFKLNQKQMMLLVGCGATGAVAGIFKAPITGVVFALEVLMLDMTMASIVPLIITAITAAVITFLATGTESMFQLEEAVSLEPERLPYYILLGLVCGLIALYFTRGSNKLEDFYKSIESKKKKLVVGGVMLSLLIFFLPPLYGEGYDTINLLINGKAEETTANSVFYDFKDNFMMLSMYFVTIIFFKVFATVATNSSGGTGGIFAPSLFIGCVAGYLTAHVINQINPGTVPENYLALAGMAGVMSGVMHAPLTSTFLIAEVTGGYGLFLSIMTTAVTAYMTIIMFEPHSLYAMQLAAKGELLTHNSDRNIQMMLKIDDLIDKNLKTLTPQMYLGDVIEAIKQSDRNIFPVLGHQHKLVGVLTINDIRSVMFQPEYYKTLQVEQMMLGASAVIYVTDTVSYHVLEQEKEIEQKKMSANASEHEKQRFEDKWAEKFGEIEGDNVETIMKKFEFTKAWNLAVVGKGTNRYIGYLSRAKVFNAYRDLLQKFSEE